MFLITFIRVFFLYINNVKNYDTIYKFPGLQTQENFFWHTSFIATDKYLKI
jgi:hypothetical protein